MEKRREEKREEDGVPERQRRGVDITVPGLQGLFRMKLSKTFFLQTKWRKQNFRRIPRLGLLTDSLEWGEKHFGFEGGSLLNAVKIEQLWGHSTL